MRIEPVFLFELDGTLVDSVYQHVLAWKEALDAEGIDLSVWRIHRKIGMSGGLFTNQLLRETGFEISAERVQRLSALHAASYLRLASDIRPLPGARELLLWLTDAGIPWAIATSGRMETAAVNLATLPEWLAEQAQQANDGPLADDVAMLLLTPSAQAT